MGNSEDLARVGILPWVVVIVAAFVIIIASAVLPCAGFIMMGNHWRARHAGGNNQPPMQSGAKNPSSPGDSLDEEAAIEGSGPVEQPHLEPGHQRERSEAPSTPPDAPSPAPWSPDDSDTSPGCPSLSFTQTDSSSELTFPDIPGVIGQITPSTLRGYMLSPLPCGTPFIIARIQREKERRDHEQREKDTSPASILKRTPSSRDPQRRIQFAGGERGPGTGYNDADDEEFDNRRRLAVLRQIGIL